MSIEYLIKENCLMVYGDGPMDDYYWEEDTMCHEISYRAPWEKAKFEKAIIMPGITCIGSEAFYFSKQLRTLVIPEGVSAIHSYAFRGCKNLISVFLPDSLETIDGCAFAECISLKSIRLPDSLRVIGDFAFAYTGLQSICLPDSLKKIESCVFANTAIKTIHIPSGVVDISETAFFGCEAEITVDPCNVIFGAENGNIYNKQMRKLLWACRPTEKTYIVPDTIRVIGKYAFSSPPELMIIPESVKELQCKSIHSIVIKEGVKELPSGLNGASEEIYLPASIGNVKPGTIRKGTVIYAPPYSAAARYAIGNKHCFHAMSEQEYLRRKL